MKGAFSFFKKLRDTETNSQMQTVLESLTKDEVLTA